eukprot:CAMPEP_0202496020 /NCGR_PEP_ID=MMETSP1361-20130828/18674_1 /ASSEMBLY_ACC=CAM_ASM_000849 /TAXON_ID=210615 /ORGANISM="Staurosira complex sp., Strain CCMP2646" /LENGTH=338 /DNA_ID=CAMNT_0049127235 /DNA_START=40 /DNA_END=1053 /DNA_ORIENTATION=+
MGNSKRKKKSISKRSDPQDSKCKDCCQICGRLLLLVTGILAVIFSLLVFASCDFVEFSVTTPSNSTDANSTDAPSTTVEFSFGQFRYQANNSECQRLADNDFKIDWTFWTGRISTAVALACAGICCLIILVEFVCCRFKFSRCLMTTLFSIAILGEAMSFIMFASNVCTSENATGRRYPCQAGTGSWYAVTAIGLYFIASLSSCFAPRPKPMIARLEDEDDPCLCCRGKKKDDDVDESKKADEEQPTAPVQEPSEPVPIQEPPSPPITPVVAAGAAAGTSVARSTQTSPPKEVKISHVYSPSDDDSSQVSSINHPSNVSAMTMPTAAFPTVSIYDGDM